MDSRPLALDWKNTPLGCMHFGQVLEVRGYVKSPDRSAASTTWSLVIISQGGVELPPCVWRLTYTCSNSCICIQSSQLQAQTSGTIGMRKSASAPSDPPLDKGDSRFFWAQSVLRSHQKSRSYPASTKEGYPPLGAKAECWHWCYRSEVNPFFAVQKRGGIWRR